LEIAMKELGPHDVVYTPTDHGTCAACGGGLFAIIHAYFADTGEPLESGVQVGCVNCDFEITDPIVTVVKLVLSNYRVKT
jgi:hypothetical protein